MFPELGAPSDWACCCCAFALLCARWWLDCTRHFVCFAANQPPRGPPRPSPRPPRDSTSPSHPRRPTCSSRGLRKLFYLQGGCRPLSRNRIQAKTASRGGLLEVMGGLRWSSPSTGPPEISKRWCDGSARHWSQMCPSAGWPSEVFWSPQPSVTSSNSHHILADLSSGSKIPSTYSLVLT